MTYPITTAEPIMIDGSGAGSDNENAISTIDDQEGSLERRTSFLDVSLGQNQIQSAARSLDRSPTPEERKSP